MHHDKVLADKIQEWLEGYLSDNEAEVRLAALSELDTRENTELIKKAQRDGDIRVRVRAALILLSCDKVYNHELLVSGMNFPSLWRPIKDGVNPRS